MSTQYDREEEDICEREAEGLISHKQAQDELRALQRAYREDAQEAAERASSIAAKQRRELLDIIDEQRKQIEELRASSGSTGAPSDQPTPTRDHLEDMLREHNIRMIAGGSDGRSYFAQMADFVLEVFARSGPLAQPTPPLNTELLMRLRQVETYARLLMEENPDLDTPCQYLAAPLRELAAFDHSPAVPLAQPTPETET